MSGLAFHQAGTAATPRPSPTTRSTRSTAASCGTPKDRKIDGVINDAAGKKAMDVLVNEMVPLTAQGLEQLVHRRGQRRDQPRARSASAFQWIAAMRRPARSEELQARQDARRRSSTSWRSRRCRSRRRTRCRSAAWACTSRAYIPAEKQAEALNFIKWFQTPEVQKKWAAARRRAGAQRRPQVARVPRGRSRTTRCSRTRCRG